jgi:hypothetical protein
MVYVGLGLIFQALSLLLLVYRLRMRWITHTGVWFLLNAILFHGLGEVFVLLFPQGNPYRTLVSPVYVDDFVLLISIAILLATMVYLATLGPPRSQRGPEEMNSALRSISNLFDWRVLLLITVPLLILTVRGQAYVNQVNPNALSTTRTPFNLGAGLLYQYIFLAVILSAFALVARFGRAWSLPVLIVQAGIFALTGGRFAMIQAGAPLVYAFYCYGIRFRKRQLALAFIFLAIAALAITGSRAITGRQAFAAGTTTTSRITALFTGLQSVGTPGAIQQLTDTLGYHFDGDSFGAMELAALHAGSAPLGLASLGHDFLLAVPHYLDPTKDITAPEYRSEKLWAEENLPLTSLEEPSGQYQDILPTQMGLTIGYFGPLGLMAFAALFGFAYGRADRWLHRGLGVGRLLVGIGLVYVAMLYPDDLSMYPLVARGLIVVLLVVGAISFIRIAVGRSISFQPGLNSLRTRIGVSQLSPRSPERSI